MPFWVPLTQLGWLARGSCSFNKKPVHNGRALDLFCCHEHSVDLQFHSSDWGLLTRHPGKSAWWFSFNFPVTLTGSFLPWSALSVLWKSDWLTERYSSWVPGRWGPGDGARSWSRIPSALASWACLLLGSEPCLSFGLCGNIPLSLQELRACLGNGYLGFPAYQPWLQNIYV